jgi:hypothetical protein
VRRGEDLDDGCNALRRDLALVLATSKNLHDGHIDDLLKLAVNIK